MKFGIISQDEKMRSWLKIQVELSGGLISDDPDVIIIFGSDRDFLEALNGIKNKLVLPVGNFGPSFFSEIGTDEVRQAIKKITSGDYILEEAMRLNVEVDGNLMPPALNEVAVFPSKSAVPMEYVLEVDGDEIFRDYSDGVIIATPTGSTAYSMSAGGPIVIKNADVMLIVPVNSIDPSRRPIVAPGGSLITIKDIGSRYECEAVVDGIERVKVKSDVKVRKGDSIKIIRFERKILSRGKIARKKKVTEEILKLPPSAKLILKVIEYEGPLSRKEIVERTLLPERTVRYAISQLLRRGLISRSMDPRNPRQQIYARR
ncbi:MAG: sugar kinase [Candidatus Methanodesulfokora sp.]